MMRAKVVVLFFTIFLLSLLVYIFYDKYMLSSLPSNKAVTSDSVDSLQVIPSSSPVSTTFSDNFEVDFVLNESSNSNTSASENWWLNSGGIFISKNGVGMTIQGDLDNRSDWYKKYLSSKPESTDRGLHPQNIFRLVTKSKWHNFTQKASLMLTKVNLSDSVERKASNGILFFNRYVDGNNLYYAGIRVDGFAVIKKKYKGVYYTLAYEPVFSTAMSAKYDAESNSNLIPANQWLAMKSEVADTNEGVEIKLYLDAKKNGQWQLVAQATDDGESYGGPAIENNGHAGIRTDFLDVLIDDYYIGELY